jgi:hypothetical protein
MFRRCEARDHRKLIRRSSISDKQPNWIHDVAQDRSHGANGGFRK